jgi:hypothetical protein
MEGAPSKNKETIVLETEYDQDTFNYLGLLGRPESNTLPLPETRFSINNL